MKTRVALLVSTLALSGLLWAVEQRAPGDGIFRRHDKNGDGRVTPDELPDAATFAKFDVNKDGAVTLDEYRQVIRGGGGAAVSPEAIKAVTSGPEILRPGDVGIGRMADDVSFTNLSGRTGKLSDFAKHKGLVIALTSSSCPVSKRQFPQLAKLEGQLKEKGVALLLVNPFASDKPTDIAAQIAENKLASPYVHDRAQALARALQASTTTEVFLLDPTRTLVYRGALDDQFGVDYSLDAPRHRYLLDAVDSLLAGRRPAVQATAAPGCELDLGPAPTAAATAVTYHRDVARILGQNCVRCHHDGGIAPFALDDLEEVRDRAKVIRRVVSEGTMPPWFAAPEKDGAPSPWANDCSLSARDKSDLLAWLASTDRPLGDPKEAPARQLFPGEWSIGTPDLIIPLSKAYDIKATGFMPYQFDVVQTTLTEDKWVTGYEILPSARDVVHHVIVRVHEKGSDPRDRGAGREDLWAAYVPGNGSNVYPAGFARKLPAGARVSFEIHYTPSGQAKKERLRIGLLFARETPRFEVRTAGIPKINLNIPPGAANHREVQTRPVPIDLPVISLIAHMHVRGKAFTFEVVGTDGKAETLLDLPHYDFNWQLRYEFKKPRVLPRGSTVRLTATFDNSAANKANPDPTKTVRWGNQTYEEMMIGYLEYFVPVSGGTASK